MRLCLSTAFARTKTRRSILACFLANEFLTALFANEIDLSHTLIIPLNAILVNDIIVKWDKLQRDALAWRGL